MTSEAVGWVLDTWSPDGMVQVAVFSAAYFVFGMQQSPASHAHLANIDLNCDYF